ncbi:pantothenate synthetase [Rubritalea halochordaticola]|uniref:Pantothenate synthetase n=1 Tax=Rubritalea halochordaticola TaxID=714537 RepID=A0ABP9V1L5_9BACT
MKRACTIEELHDSLPLTEHKAVLVPTMGALHEGHFSLIRKAREIAGPHGRVAVSIFVNPIQFDRESDLASYPCTLDKDLEACQKLGVDIVFTPEVESVYHPDRSITIHETSLSKLLCGATREGHFDGVCTVVAKLFNLFRPTDAVFGKKDYQQLAIIHRLVRDLNIPVTIHGAETVREEDGLALSSRNVRLTQLNREQAPIIREALVAARNAVDAGEKSADVVKSIALNTINAVSTIPRIDYLECVDAETLEAVESIDKLTLLATAVFFGDVRLIDNIELEPQG